MAQRSGTMLLAECNKTTIGNGSAVRATSSGPAAIHGTVVDE
jgi:hypothetical protein